MASVFGVLASQLSEFTGGEDGVIESEVFGRAIDGKLLTYYLVFAASAALFLLLLRIVNSHFGRVLQASASA